MPSRRLWFRVHSVLGVLAGLLLFVVCWSGTVAVVSHEIDWLLDARLRVTPRSERATWGQIHAAVLRAHPDARNISLEAPLSPRAAAVAVLDLPRQPYVRVYVDPYTAEVRGHTSYFNVQRFFRSFHMSFFDFGGVGYYVVSAFALVLLLSLVTPLLFYRRWWRGFFTLETGRGRRPFWSDVHALAGLWGFWFALLIGLTGVWYLVELFGADLGYPDLTPAASQAGPVELPLDSLIQVAGARWPELRVEAVQLPADWTGGALLLHGSTDAWLVRPRANQLFLHPMNGEVLAQQTAQGLGWPARWVDTADPLHFGNFAGLGSKVPWFLFGLALSGLSLTGAWLHAQRLARTGERSRWRGTRTSLGLALAVLAASAVAGYREILSYGPEVQGARVLPEVPLAVTGFITAWSATTVAVLIWWSRLVTRRSSPRALPLKPEQQVSTQVREPDHLSATYGER